MLILKRFQKDIIDELIQTIRTLKQNKFEKLLLKAPTGSGKTIILISFIHEYLLINQNTTFIWLTPGNGDLEEQSRNKMRDLFPEDNAFELGDALTCGFLKNATYFINWEKITKKKNKARAVSEINNLDNWLEIAKQTDQQIILIIDEEHRNKTTKSQEIIEKINPSFSILVSATPDLKNNFNTKLIEIKESEVIDEELITRKIVINPGFKEKIHEIEEIENQNHFLVQKAIELRNEIANAYLQINKKINPLVLIQFPNMDNELINNVINWLKEAGYTISEDDVATWFSDADLKTDQDEMLPLKKVNLSNITKSDNKVKFLLFKQAIATGWDCPRAKILVKLRLKMDEDFEIQTIGRIRRMPEACHYDNEILNNCYLLTFDEKYNEATLQGIDDIERRVVSLKKEPREWQLKKMVADQDKDLVDDSLVLENIYNFFKTKYDLNDNCERNQNILENHHYLFLGSRLKKQILTGEVVDLQQINDELEVISLNLKMKSHDLGFELRNTIDSFKRYLGITYNKTRKLLEALFSNSLKNKKWHLCKISEGSEFACFVLNNKQILKDDLKEFYSSPNNQEYIQQQYSWDKAQTIRLKTPEIYKETKNKDRKLLQKNVYYDYYDSFADDNKTKSMSERLFENYCENKQTIKFVYKNKDKGPEYLSVLYQTGNLNTMLFYPDYVVQTTENKFYIIETKGGENPLTNEDQNVDLSAKNKFLALQNYARNFHYEFAFIRNIGNKLYYCNSEYQETMQNGVWKPIEELF